MAGPLDTLAPQTEIETPVAPDFVIGFGGNAFKKGIPALKGDPYWQSFAPEVKIAAKEMVDRVEAGDICVFGHGNGPQAGKLLCDDPNTRLPKHTETTQKEMGNLLKEGIINEFKERGNVAKEGYPEVVVVITHVRVDPNDPAFTNPSKPIGWYTEEKVKELYTALINRGVNADIKLVNPDEPEGKGWRLIVPSPKPLEIVEIDEIREHLAAGRIVIAVGGGGIPVDAEGNRLESVIDKDLALALLGVQLKAKKLMILTKEDHAYINYKNPNKQAIARMTVSQAERFQGEGHFEKGNMNPKIEGAIYFNRNTGNETIIAPLGHSEEAIQGKIGTRITPDSNGASVILYRDELEEFDLGRMATEASV